MVANRPLGVAEALLLARGFSRRKLLGLVRQGLATPTYERRRAGGKMKITGRGGWRCQGFYGNRLGPWFKMILRWCGPRSLLLCSPSPANVAVVITLPLQPPI
jgi:hypothetical protein